MPYLLKVPEDQTLSPGQYVNAAGHAECVEFVRQAAGAPATAGWRPGAHVMSAALGTIARGTAIATFDEQGRYPTDAQGKHAAIYLSHGPDGIVVLDQWRRQGRVLRRVIRPRATVLTRSNAAGEFWVIE